LVITTNLEAQDTPFSGDNYVRYLVDFRAFFPSKAIAENPLTEHLIRDIPAGGDRRDVWLGPDVHFIYACVKNGKEFSWKVTHKDIGDVEEGWVLPGKISDALKVIEGWDPVLQEIVKVRTNAVWLLMIEYSARSFIWYRTEVWLVIL
jgi:hypothetical protein